MVAVNKSYLGKGTIYLKEIGAATGALSIGNASEFNLAFNEDKKEQKDYNNAGGGVVNTVAVIDSVTGTITMLDVSASNMALALRGLVTTHAIASVTSEAHVAYNDGFIKCDFIADMTTMDVQPSGGGTPHVLDTDYSLGINGIVIIAGGGIVDASTIELNYTSKASYKIQGLASAGLEYELTLDGLNEADSGNAVSLKAYRIKINPAQALSMLGDDFATLPVTFDMLSDATITGAGLSKYIEIEVTQ